MPLHRNESSEQKTLAFKNQNTFMKENHMLSRERVTCFTIASSSNEIKVMPEFVFKGAGTRTTINAPPGIHYQWSPTVILQVRTFEKNNFEPSKQVQHVFGKNFAIYVLDDYAVHHARCSKNTIRKGLHFGIDRWWYHW